MLKPLSTAYNVTLYVQVLVHESTCTSLLSSSKVLSWIPGTIFSDMGLHQLKGIASLTRIFQVRANVHEDI